MSALSDRLHRLASTAQTPARPPVDERPGCAYGAVTRQTVADLREQAGRIEAKVNAILAGISVAVVVQILLGLAK